VTADRHLPPEFSQVGPGGQEHRPSPDVPDRSARVARPRPALNGPYSISGGRPPATPGAGLHSAIPLGGCCGSTPRRRRHRCRVVPNAFRGRAALGVSGVFPGAESASSLLLDAAASCRSPLSTAAAPLDLPRGRGVGTGPGLPLGAQKRDHPTPTGAKPSWFLDQTSSPARAALIRFNPCHLHRTEVFSKPACRRHVELSTCRVCWSRQRCDTQLSTCWQHAAPPVCWANVMRGNATGYRNAVRPPTPLSSPPTTTACGCGPHPAPGGARTRRTRRRRPEAPVTANHHRSSGPACPRWRGRGRARVPLGGAHPQVAAAALLRRRLQRRLVGPAPRPQPTPGS